MMTDYGNGTRRHDDGPYDKPNYGANAAAGSDFTMKQGDRVPGYRKLSEEELGLVAESKELEAHFNAFIDKLKATPGIDQRNVALAATHGEDAFMRAVRAVAQPIRLLP